MKKIVVLVLVLAVLLLSACEEKTVNTYRMILDTEEEITVDYDVCSSPANGEVRCWESGWVAFATTPDAVYKVIYFERITDE